jgi:hypothetical protein
MKNTTGLINEIEDLFNSHECSNVEVRQILLTMVVDQYRDRYDPDIWIDMLVSDLNDQHETDLCTTVEAQSATISMLDDLNDQGIINNTQFAQILKALDEVFE